MDVLRRLQGEFQGGNSKNKALPWEMWGLLQAQKGGLCGRGVAAGRVQWDVDERQAGAKSHGTTEMAPVFEEE